MLPCKLKDSRLGGARCDPLSLWGWRRSPNLLFIVTCHA